jgi:hypothetical protein
MNTRTNETEMLDVLMSVVTKAKMIDVDGIRSAQDAMLNIHVEWEELQSRLRNRKIDGFEPAVEAMLQLSATTMAMASALQAKIINQRIRQMEQEKISIAEKMSAIIAESKVGKQRKRKSAISK